MADYAHPKMQLMALNGITSDQITGWIQKYSLPLLMDVLNAFNGSFNNLTVTQISTWVEEALAAMAAGNPLPSMPVPTK